MVLHTGQSVCGRKPSLTQHPECKLQQSKPSCVQVDVYSYGIVLWELWTGREPFEGLNYHALLHQMTSAGEAMRPPLPGSADWDAAQVCMAVGQQMIHHSSLLQSDIPILRKFGLGPAQDFCMPAQAVCH